MLIECRGRRKPNHINPDGGTKLDLFGRKYHFKPQPDRCKAGQDPDAHICDVIDDRAIQLLLAIPESYNKFGLPPQIPAKVAAKVAPGQPSITTQLIDDDDELGEPDSPEVDVLAAARAAQDEWIAEMLAKPTKAIGAMDLSELDDDTLEKVLEAEQAAAKRVTVTKLVAGEQAKRKADNATNPDAEGGEGDGE